MRQGQVLTRHLGHLDNSPRGWGPRGVSGPKAGSLGNPLSGCPGQMAEGKAAKRRTRDHLGEALGLKGGAGVRENEKALARR